MTLAQGDALIPGRVSLVVPCYNVEIWLEQFIASVLDQSHDDLEVILVNDGANAATTQMLRDAVPRLQARGYVVRLIEQANKGLGGAVDAGIKHFTGEFLMWPDPDDWLTPDSVERRVALMRANPDIGLLRTNAALFDEARQVFDGHFMPLDAPTTRPVDLLEHLLFLRRYHAPVCHMVRGDMFLAVHPDRTIWFGPASSQNFQLLVPFVERFPVLELPGEVLANYRARDDSRSRAHGASREKLMARYDQLFELADRTMPRLQTCTPERLARMRDFHWRNRMMPTAFRAAMRDRLGVLIAQSGLDARRKRMARALVALRCNGLLRAVDGPLRQGPSRLLARMFDRVVMLPPRDLTWGAKPLWA